MRYTMAPAPDCGIVLERGGQELRYHTSGSAVKFVRPELYLDDDLGFLAIGEPRAWDRPKRCPAHATAATVSFMPGRSSSAQHRLAVIASW
jgi:D-serine deaminase-like pyridoxal phosphate-dependent protein